MTLGEEAVAEEAGRGGWEVEGLRRPKRNKMHPARVNVHVVKGEPPSWTLDPL